MQNSLSLIYAGGDAKNRLSLQFQRLKVTLGKGSRRLTGDRDPVHNDARARGLQRRSCPARPHFRSTGFTHLSARASVLILFLRNSPAARRPLRRQGSMDHDVPRVMRYGSKDTRHKPNLRSMDACLRRHLRTGGSYQRKIGSVCVPKNESWDAPERTLASARKNVRTVPALPSARIAALTRPFRAYLIFTES
jgi:hypothetical protein